MANLVIPDGGNIGSASDTDAISISSSGAVTLSSDFVPATPLSHRNVVINGGMQVWQRGTGEVTISQGNNEGYTTVDRFKMDFGNSCPGGVKWSRATEVPDLSGGDMFTYSLKVQVSTAETTPNSNQLATIDYRVEAHDMQRFGWGKTNKKDAVLSFYLKTNKTGVYSWYFQTPGTGTARHRMISFTVSDTNWNRYSIPVSADTVAITDANTEGLQIRLNLINSPSLDYTSGTDSGWGTTTYVNDDDQVNFLDNTSNILYFTGMQFEVGSVATPFEHRSYGEELARCQRYYYELAFPSGNHVAVSYNNYPRVNGSHPVTMRSAPSSIDESSGWDIAGTATIYSGYYSTQNADTAGPASVTFYAEL